MSTSTPPPVPSTPAAGLPAGAASALSFAIEDLAQLFRLEVDTARELTYRTDFPQPIKIGRRWLWFPDEVLAWMRKQKRYSTDERKRNAAGPAPETAPEQPTIKPHKPRTKKPGQAAA